MDGIMINTSTPIKIKQISATDAVFRSTWEFRLAPESEYELPRRLMVVERYDCDNVSLEYYDRAVNSWEHLNADPTNIHIEGEAAFGAYSGLLYAFHNAHFDHTRAVNQTQDEQVVVFSLLASYRRRGDVHGAPFGDDFHAQFADDMSNQICVGT